MRKQALALRLVPTHSECSDCQTAAAPDPAPAPAELAAQSLVPTVPLPEAPVSITLKATLHGYEVLVTLCGVDFASVKAQVEHASAWLQLTFKGLG